VALPREDYSVNDKLELRDWISLLALSAIWGASFFFLRVAAPVFGPVPLIAARVFFRFLPAIARFPLSRPWFAAA
jgi:drug/metabolite transporter (DMT)-like permease